MTTCVFLYLSVYIWSSTSTGRLIFLQREIDFIFLFIPLLISIFGWNFEVRNDRDCILPFIIDFPTSKVQRDFLEIK